MSAPLALSATKRGVRRSPLALLALLAATILTLMGGVGTAHADGKVPDKPKDLIYVTEGAEISAPDMDGLTSLMTGLNDAHKEKVGVIITDEKTDAQGLADKALKEWGLSKNGALIVITTTDQGVGVAVGSSLKKNVPSDARSDVANKVNDGIGQYADWASGVQTGATRLFLYIEGQGLSGGTDDHHHEDGAEDHTHEADDPAVEEVPSGEAPDDAYVEEGNESASETDSESTDPMKIAGGVAIAVAAGVALFLLYRTGRKKEAAKKSSAEAGDADGDPKEKPEE